MNWEKIRQDIAIFLFNAFSVVSVFHIIKPFYADTVETITINNQTLYINVGWLWIFFLTLILVLVLNLLFLQRKREFLMVIGVFAGSLVLLNTYTYPALVQIISDFNKQGLRAMQHYIPHMAAVIGTFMVLGLLKIYNAIFK